MSDTPYGAIPPPHAPPPAQPPPPAVRSRRGRRRLIVLGVASALVLGSAIGAGVWWLNRDSQFPDEWDPTVAEFVTFVEKERGLAFEHPVYVDFLSEDDFRDEVTSKESDLTDEERKEIEQTSGLMRALGLLAHDVDLFEAINELSAGGILGLYDSEDKRIRMRGEELTPAVKSTLVHELTHALQDQHFDLLAAAQKHEEDEEDEDTSAAAAWGALVEGDADRIEEKYAESLSDTARSKLLDDQEADSNAAFEDLEDVPPFLITLISSSYAFGGALVGLAVELEGEKHIDALFEEPPTTEEHLLDPWTLLLDEQEAKEVETPEIEDDEEEIDTGTFGAPSWLFFLAERIDPLQALTAADGWGGDQYVDFTRGDTSCVRIDYVGDTRRDVTEMRRALDRWIARGPKGTADVRAHGDGLRFTSCDPGEGARAGNGGSGTAMELAVTRTYLAIEAGGAELAPVHSRCYAAGIINEFSLEELMTDEAGPEFYDRLEEATAHCG